MNIFGKIAEMVKVYDDAHNFTCDICGREVFAGERVCVSCKKTLPWNDGKVCPLCGRRVKEEGICLECKYKRLPAERVRAPFRHEGEAARLVVRFKRGRKYLYRACAELMFPLMQKEFPDAEGIVFVPMTKKAEKVRGYNQARLLAMRLGELSGLPVLDAVVKQRETDNQKALTRAEREKNLERCFHVTMRKEVKGKILVIVDDTLTTGATIGELASTLLRAGAKKVYALTVTNVENKAPFGKQ